jgi:hypothetical protein
MITAIVQFSLPKPISLEEAARAFESTAPKYQGLRGPVPHRTEEPRGFWMLFAVVSALEAVRASDDFWTPESHLEIGWISRNHSTARGL